MEERLLGFDARQMWLGFDWESDRRQIYLLREDLEKPLSTDTMVWERALDLSRIKSPDWIGANDLWEDLSRLRKFLAKQKKLRSRVWIIAVTWLCEDVEAYRAECDVPYLRPVDPSDVDPRWQLLGYDISDMGLLSGLSGCGYTAPDDVTALRAQWGGKLNRFHLFEDVSDAQQFRNMTDERVKEHAPFSVYGVYLVERIE